MKKIIAMILGFSMMLSFCGCNNGEKKEIKKDNTDKQIPEIVTGTMTFKNFGTITFELYPTKAPQSVYNFIYLAKMGWYDGIVVHRLVNDFVIQAGAYVSGYNQKVMTENYSIKGEFSSNGIDNPVSHKKGTLSWARTSVKDSASTQFFICTNDMTASQLDGNYAAFGNVTDGFDVIDAINAVQTSRDVPVTEIEIESVKIDSTFDFPKPDFIEK